MSLRDVRAIGIGLALLCSLAPSGCGGGNGQGDGAADARVGDAAAAGDQSMPGAVDLLGAGDGAPPAGDLATGDMSQPAGPGMCPPATNYGEEPADGGGTQQPCGLAATCSGHTYALDCDGSVCSCSFDGSMTTAFIQMPNSCQMLPAEWTSFCNF